MSTTKSEHEARNIRDRLRDSITAAEALEDAVTAVRRAMRRHANA
jgi:hypothetical protein